MTMYIMYITYLYKRQSSMIIMKNLFWIMIDRMMTIGVISIGNSQLSRIRLMAGALIDTKYMYVNQRLN